MGDRTPLKQVTSPSQMANKEETLIGDDGVSQNRREILNQMTIHLHLYEGLKSIVNVIYENPPDNHVFLPSQRKQRDRQTASKVRISQRQIERENE